MYAYESYQDFENACVKIDLAYLVEKTEQED
jgi:hypothetical protein